MTPSSVTELSSTIAASRGLGFSPSRELRKTRSLEEGKSEQCMWMYMGSLTDDEGGPDDVSSLGVRGKRRDGDTERQSTHVLDHGRQEEEEEAIPAWVEPHQPDQTEKARAIS